MFLSLRALWKALRGNSLTFSLVFAVAVLGGSLAFLFSILLIGFLARREQKLPLRLRFKRLCSLLLIVGSLILGAIFWRYQAHLEKQYENSFVPGPKFEEPRRELPRRGPPHRR
ncbi:MAG: hypothetical protein GVY10_01240 [Verrucomicrobia bacterium]|nr:hypothetical protein [Verrucomicrobiota bacterium]